jgi:tRNA (adenine37-N6)-methyltransferase
MKHQEFVLRSIGVVSSPHTDHEKTPIQPVFAKGIKGMISIDDEFVEGLDDLEGFSHIFVFYVFHEEYSEKLTVKPFLEDVQRGVFSTRAPCRPNRIGFSLLRLASVEGNVLHVEDVDILDGTPVLDIKPYIARFDVRGEVRSGWQESVSDEAAIALGRRGFREPPPGTGESNRYESVTDSTRRLLEGQESRNVDFKLDPAGIDAEDVVAFANAGGGTILAGVSESEDENGIQRGSIQGCSVDDRTRQSIMGKASSCRPAVDIQIQIENAAERPILRIDIPEGGSKPYCTASGTYKIRSEGRNVAIDPPLMKAMILQSEVDAFVRRFKHAGNELLQGLQSVERDLVTQIGVLRETAEKASRNIRTGPARSEDTDPEQK